MRPQSPLVALVLMLALGLPLLAQTEAGGASDSAATAPVATAPAATAPTPALPSATGAASAPQKADALLLYRQGRDLEAAGKTADATALYNQAVSICDRELGSDPKRMDAYAVKCWSLFRLGRHQEVISVGASAIKIVFDARIVEVMGESYYFLGKNDLAIQSFEKYLESGQFGDRVSTAYFFLGETYLRMRKWSHADIAYTTAVKREPSMSRWWYRLGQVCENLGEWQRASDAYTKALSLTPGMQEATEGLSRAKAKLGT